MLEETIEDIASGGAILLRDYQVLNAFQGGFVSQKGGSIFIDREDCGRFLHL